MKRKRDAWERLRAAGLDTRTVLKVNHKTECKNAAKIVKSAVIANEERIVSKAKKYPKILHAYIRKKQIVRNQIRAIKETGEITEDGEKICNLFNEYFQPVFVLEPEEVFPIFEERCSYSCSSPVFIADNVQKCLERLYENLWKHLEY